MAMPKCLLVYTPQESLSKPLYQDGYSKLESDALTNIYAVAYFDKLISEKLVSHVKTYNYLLWQSLLK